MQERTRELQALRDRTKMDFAGFASVVRGRETLLYWKEASGNRNRDYMKIVLEPGKGIAGGVYQNRKALVVRNVEEEYEESSIVHSPILLAEHLLSFAAFPLWENDIVEGVLLLGARTSGAVTRESYETMHACLSEGFSGMEVRPEPYQDAVDTLHEHAYRALPIYTLVEIPVRTALREERQRIARDLHDSVIQNLTGVQLQLRTLKYDPDPEKIREGLRIADESLTNIQKELREILVSVRSGVLDDFGLTAAFRRHFEFLEASFPVKILFLENIGNHRFSSDIETVFYRIGQEAVANACKYSQADTVEVRLTLADRKLSLEIEDTGKGFDTRNIRIAGGGMGIPGMDYWAGYIGGTLVVRSAPEQGTRIRLEVPLG